MYRLDDVGSTFLSLPPNLQTTENECFGYALDRQIARMHKLAKQITVWSDLDHVDPKYYDYLAMTIRAPYYKSEYDNNQKLGLIKSALLTRRNAGTIKAIEELMSHTLTGASFIPWYEYGGRPYFFKVVADADEVNDDNMGEFVRMISAIKSARSIMEGIGMKSVIDNSMLYDMRLNRVCFYMRTPFFSILVSDGVMCHDVERKYKLGVGLVLHLGIKGPREEICNMTVESRRNVQYYNGKKRYNGTTKYNAMIRRHEIE
nr:phage tail protein [uncultured Acetatifactor sp.]